MSRNKNIYINRINKCIDFIERNLDKELSLDILAEEACFSKFHFSRLFQAITGESPFQFILRLKIEKAASLLQGKTKDNITDIAFKCGFTDITNFSKNFKNYYGVSARKFRKSGNSNSRQVKSNKRQLNGSVESYFCSKTFSIKWRSDMKLLKDVQIIKMQEMELAYVRNIGEYDGDQKKFQEMRNKLFAWAAEKGILNSEDFKFMVMYHDNPNTVLSNNLRMSLCISIPKGMDVSGEISKMDFEASKYAIARFELKGDEFESAWNWLYSKWLPESACSLDDKAYFELYTKAPDDGIYIIDFCIPVK